MAGVVDALRCAHDIGCGLPQARYDRGDAPIVRVVDCYPSNSLQRVDGVCCHCGIHVYFSVAVFGSIVAGSSAKRFVPSASSTYLSDPVASMELTLVSGVARSLRPKAIRLIEGHEAKRTS